jgi:hypothetical protein
MPPLRYFCDLKHLFGGEKIIAAPALLFSIYSHQNSPFFVLIAGTALDNNIIVRITNDIVGRVRR